MSHSGGGVSFSGGPYSYNVSYSQPTFTPPSGSSLYSVTITSAGPGSVSCGSGASQTYEAKYRVDANIYTYESATVSGTAPACPPPPTYPPSWLDNTLGGFQKGVAYSDTLAASNTGYNGTYYLASGTLPDGISLSYTTGTSGIAILSGTPTTEGAYSFTIAASNSYGTITQSFTGTVTAAPTAGKIRVFNGASWVYGPVKVFSGSSWLEGQAYVYNGSAWVKSV